MSASPPFTPEQEARVREIAREEVRRILQAAALSTSGAFDRYEERKRSDGTAVIP